MAVRRVLLLGIALAAVGAAHGQNAIGEVYAGDASVRGAVLLSTQGTQLLSGSQVTAGDGAAMLRLKRGGHVRICPRASLSVSTDTGGNALALSMNVGAMELHYTLTGSADVVMTPDFRIQLISPGTFHLAINVGPSGDTCLRTLPGNNSSIFISEMLGDNSYQLSPGKSVMFVGGRISGATLAPDVCGCPETRAETLAIESAVPPPPAASEAQPASAAQPLGQPMAENQPPAAAAAVTHLEMDSRFVYRGDDVGPDYFSSVSGLSLSTDNSKLALALMPQVSGPPAPAPATGKKSGFLHWLGHLFGR